MRLERLLTLLSIARQLAGNAEGLTLDEIAAVGGVDRRTAERFRDLLRDLFPTFEERREGRSKRFVIGGGLDSFMLAPSPDELAELQNAIKALEKSHHGARAMLLRSLDTKVRGALRASQRRKIEPDLEALMAAEGFVMQAGPRPMVASETLALMRQALKAGCLCQFTYLNAAGLKARQHVVRPWGLLYGKVYYLVGATRKRDEPVLWRIDRMSDLRLGAAAQPPPPDFDLTAFSARSFGVFQERPENIVLRFSRGAAMDVKNFIFHPSQSVEQERGGKITVRFRSGGLLELVRHLFSWGDAVEIVEPVVLKEMMVDELENALAQHRHRRSHPGSSDMASVRPLSPSKLSASRP